MKRWWGGGWISPLTSCLLLGGRACGGAVGGNPRNPRNPFNPRFRHGWAAADVKDTAEWNDEAVVGRRGCVRPILLLLL